MGLCLLQTPADPAINGELNHYEPVLQKILPETGCGVALTFGRDGQIKKN
jgi:hypothetical protein